MKIDLFKLNNFSYLDIDSDITIPEEFYENMDVRNVLNTHVEGSLKIDYEESIEANLLVKGTFVLPCAITLEDVLYDFECEIEENIGKFEDFYDKNKNSLDILPFIWENIVSEVPIRVIKEGVEPQDINGDGWELISSGE